LQKGGKIGRIEIDASQSGSKTYGKLYLPASLDRIDTCILGAAIESVDRVGPFDAQFQVEQIEDTRSEKRKKILDRAKELLRKLLSTELPDSKELAELVESEVKANEISSYGPERLPAGPGIADSNEVIIVEGRADVINLLKSDITNVVAVGGATSTIPKSIIDLSKEKEVTVFVDGDRGGDLIIRALANAIDIDYVARAPEGKEVEELTRKEIIKALRSKVPLDQYFSVLKQKENQQYNNNHFQRREAAYNHQQPEKTVPAPKPVQSPQPPSEKGFEPTEVMEPEPEDSLPEISSAPAPSDSGRPTKPVLESMLLSELANSLEELSGTLRSRLYGVDGSIIKEVPIRELLTELQNTPSVYGIVLDGVVTQRLVELALQKGVKAIYGLRANPMPKLPSEMIIYTKEQGKLN